jgi:N-acetylglutamate synthase/N-acetylornithine aminotransferase
MESLVANAKGDYWHNAAKAIMTTDTFLKVATATANVAVVMRLTSTALQNPSRHALGVAAFAVLA